MLYLAEQIICFMKQKTPDAIEFALHFEKLNIDHF